MQLKFVATIALMVISCNLLAQAVLPRPVVPPSPNAASLGKYGEVPVSMANGVPDISVPVYEINSGRIKVPISFSYHAGGIRVEESASWVGLGWTLFAGGAITRTMRGRPDDDPGIPGGYFNYHNNMTINRLLQGPDNPTPETWQPFWQEYYKGVNRNIDAEPDLFQLNVPGLSCRFYYNQQQQTFYTVPASKIKITHTGDAVNGSTWEIVNQDGLIYTFNESETTDVPWDARTGYTIPTTWMLTSISDPLTNRGVAFQYEQLTSSSDYANGLSEVSLYPIYTGDEPHGNVSSTFVLHNSGARRQLRLKKILFLDGEIDFTLQDVARLDFPADKALKKITVKNYMGQVVKTCELNTSYFLGGQASIPPLTNNTVPDMYNYRLKLDNIYFKNADGTETQTYKFDYNEYMTNRLSTSQDRWGYFNNQTNEHLVEEEYITVAGQIRRLPGGNRNVAEYVNQIGMLQRITYPTGGYTEFEYESNRYSVPGSPGSVTYNIDTRWGVLSHISSVREETQWVSRNETTFKVNGNEHCGGAGAVIYGNIGGLEPNRVEGCPAAFAELWVRGIDPGNSNISIGLANNYTHNIPPGNYKITLEMRHCDPVYYESASGLWYLTDCYPNYTSPTGVADKLVGGLRIKSINSYSRDGQLASRKTYDYTDGITEGFSSGTIPSEMINSYFMTRLEGSEANGEVMRYHKRTSYSCVPLATTKGSPISYNRVKETQWNGTETNGFTVFYFTSTDDFPDLSYPNNLSPFKPVVNRDYMRGELKRKEVYAIKDGAPYLLQVINNEFTTIENTTQNTISYGFNGGVKEGEAFWEGTIPYSDYQTKSPQLGIYKEFSDALLVSKNKETVYDETDPQRSSTTVTEYEYSPLNLQPNKTVTYVESYPAEKKMAKIKYPLDYFQTTSQAVDANMTGIQRLVDINRINQPVEQVVGNDKSGVKKVLSAQLTLFDNNIPLEKQVDKLEIDQPIAETVISENQSGNLFKHAAVKPALEILHYDGEGNILDQRLADNTIESYIWGYQRSYPVAKIIGITHADAVAQSGIDLNLLYNQNGQYSDQQMRAELNKLRSLQNCLVTTYTYSPLVGITSETDPRGRTIYYEYDGFKRLLRIRDAENNILKQWEYQYQVTASNGPIWQATGNTRCKPCAQNAAYNTNIIQQEQRNINPLSTATTRWVDIGTGYSCIIQPNWQNTTTPLRCHTVNGANTGEREQEQQDVNPCSAQGLRWVIIDQNCASCPKPENWQPTGNYRCVTNAMGDYTGEQEQEQVNLNSCTSPQATRWQNTGMNIAACRPPIYARIRHENVISNHADIVVTFWLDEACTIPISLTNQVINYTDMQYHEMGDITYVNYTKTVSGQEIVLEEQYPLTTYEYIDGLMWQVDHFFMLAPGDYYNAF